MLQKNPWRVGGGGGVGVTSDAFADIMHTTGAHKQVNQFSIGF